MTLHDLLSVMPPARATPRVEPFHGPKVSRGTSEICAMIAVQQFADAAAAAYGACADAPLLDLLDQRNRQRLKKVPSACARGSRVIARNGEIAMKLIDVAPAARVIIAAMICVVAGSANAQEIGSVQEGRQLAREVCAECHAIDNAASGSANPNAPTFKVIANTPGMTSAALTVALQTTHMTMPNFVIKGDALQNIIAYILSLKERN